MLNQDCQRCRKPAVVTKKTVFSVTEVQDQEHQRDAEKEEKQAAKLQARAKKILADKALPKKGAGKEDVAKKEDQNGQNQGKKDEWKYGSEYSSGKNNDGNNIKSGSGIAGDEKTAAGSANKKANIAQKNASKSTTASSAMEPDTPDPRTDERPPWAPTGNNDQGFFKTYAFSEEDPAVVSHPDTIKLDQKTFENRRIPISQIRFSQACISSAFQDGRTLEEMVSQIKTADDIDLLLRGTEMKCVQHEKDIYSVDNRRLYCVKEASRKAGFGNSKINVKW